MKAWTHKDEWKMPGKDFLISVSRHSVAPSLLPGHVDEGLNRWAVYAYIYPKHPHFSKFDSPDMWQAAAVCLPLHGGPSFLRFHTDGSVTTSIQVGADYNHLHDEEYGYYASKEDAWSVFVDAENLHKRLSQLEHAEVPA